MVRRINFSPPLASSSRCYIITFLSKHLVMIMTDSLHSFRIKAKVAALASILLMLWLNFAVIEHQLDTSSSHHNEHHCQLFASVSNGLAQHVAVLPIWVSHNYLTPSSELFSITLLYLAYLARSPPHQYVYSA